MSLSVRCGAGEPISDGKGHARLPGGTLRGRSAPIGTPSIGETFATRNTSVTEPQPESREATLQRYKTEIALRNGRLLLVNRVAWVLATHPDPAVRDGELALRLARLAGEAAATDRPELFGTLAAALAECGRFCEAACAAANGSRLAAHCGWHEAAKALARHRDLYLAELPWRDASISSLRLIPRRATSQLAYAWYVVAERLAASGNDVSARVARREAIRLDARSPVIRTATARCLITEGKPWEAVAELTAAVADRGEDPDLLVELAILYQRLGRESQACEFYRRALRLRPDWPEVANNLAWLLATSADKALRNGDEAVRWATAACATTRDVDPLLLDTLAAAYAEAGRYDDAAATAQRALALLGGNAPAVADGLRKRMEGYVARRPTRQPDPQEMLKRQRARQLETLARRGWEFQSEGELDRAILAYMEVLENQPDRLDVANNLAWIAATNVDGRLRNGRLSLGLALKICHATEFNNPYYLDTLAAAYAEVGDFRAAGEHARRALSMLASNAAPGVADSIRQRLQGYEAGRPARHAGAENK